MKVVFMGTPDFSVGTLEALVEAGYEITGVVTQPDKPKGRGKQMMPTPVKEAAEKHGLPEVSRISGLIRRCGVPSTSMTTMSMRSTRTKSKS